MKTKFMIQGSSVSIFKMNEETVLDILPPRIYTVCFSQLNGFYLEMTKDLLEIPTKIYGTTLNRADKCLYTYKDRTTSTGILLTGDKGTGKTLLMSLLANKVITELKLPVILIRDAYSGAKFISFIESIGECCLVFDEFGKLYSSNKHGEDVVNQNALLSLMDGVDKTKRLIIMTENSEMDINEFMLNRPSRVYYHFRYNKLDEDSITGYCDDHGVNTPITRDIIDLSRRSKIFSFDMLQSIVEEQLRFNSSIEEITSELNVDISQAFGASMEITKIIVKGSDELRELYNTAFVTKPERTGYTYIKMKKNHPSTDNDDDDYDEIYIQPSNLVYEHKGNLVYETTKFTITAKDVPNTPLDYFKLL